MKGWATCYDTATAHSEEGEKHFLTIIPKVLKLSENCVYIINNRVNCIKRRGRQAF